MFVYRVSGVIVIMFIIHTLDNACVILVIIVPKSNNILETYSSVAFGFFLLHPFAFQTRATVTTGPFYKRLRLLFE